MNDLKELVFISVCVETNVLLKCGDKQDYEINMLGRPTELMVSNVACISEYALKSDSDGYFEISFFPDDYLQTMREAESRIKEKHGNDLIFPIRHRKMGTSFSIYLTEKKENWIKMSKTNEFDSLIETMTQVLIGTANRFINSYRLVAGDSYVKNLADDNCRVFSFVRSSEEQIVTAAKNPYVGQRIVWDEEKQEKLDSLLSQKSEPDFPLDRVLIDAFGLRTEGNLIASFITLVTALEIIIYEIYQKRLSKMNIHEDKIEEILGYRFSDLIKKKDFHQILGVSEKEFIDEKRLTKISQAYKKRNMIVHSGKKIPDEELINSWNDVNEFIEYFLPKVQNLFFNPPENIWGKRNEPKEKLVFDLINTWKEIMAGTPDGFYAFSAKLSSKEQEHTSIVVKKDTFPQMVAEFLISLWPEKPLELTVYVLESNGTIRPITGFRKTGEPWAPPEEIALILKSEFEKNLRSEYGNF